MQTFDTRLAHLSRVHHIHGWYYMLSYLQSRSTFSSPHLIFTFMDSETVGWFTCEKRQQFFPWVCASCKLHYMFLHGSCVKGFVAIWQSDTELDAAPQLWPHHTDTAKTEGAERGCEPAEASSRADHSYSATRALILCKMLELVSLVPWNQCSRKEKVLCC